jgi:hypothetical protein
MVNILLSDEESLESKYLKLGLGTWTKMEAILRQIPWKKLPIYKEIGTCLSSDKYKANTLK